MFSWRAANAGDRRNQCSPWFLVLLAVSLIGHTDASVSAQGAEEADDATYPIEIPIELVMGRPLVRAKVNDRGPVGLLIDPQVDTMHVGLALADLVDHTPNGVEPTVDLDFGELTVEDIPVALLDAAKLVPEFSTRGQPDGVLGLSVWPDQLVTLDYQRMRVRIEPGTLPEPNGRDVFATRPGTNELRVRLTIDSHTIECRVDPQFSAGLLLPWSYLGQLALLDEPKDVIPVLTREGVVAVREARLAGSVSVADTEYASPTVLFGRVDDVGLLGYGWLKRLAITYDKAHGRARLGSRGPSQEPSEEGNAEGKVALTGGSHSP